MLIFHIVLFCGFDSLLEVGQFCCLFVSQVKEGLVDFLVSFFEPDLFLVRVKFFNFLLDTMGFDVVLLLGHLLFHFSEVEQFRRFLDFGAELKSELVF